MTCHFRGDELITSVAMRSNNALRLLPYNIFEFTMLAELIASELDVGLGAYWHSASSLHVFTDELDSAKELSADEPLQAGKPQMPAMPAGELLPEQTALLVEYEAELRSSVVAKDWPALSRLLNKAEAELLPYWFSLFSVLVLFAAARAQATRHIDAEEILDRVPPALSVGVREILPGLREADTLG